MNKNTRRKPMYFPSRFYVGSRDLACDPDSKYLHNTMESAIQEAESRCADQNGKQIVVEIVAFVEPSKPPVRTVRLATRRKNQR